MIKQLNIFSYTANTINIVLSVHNAINTIWNRRYGCRLTVKVMSYIMYVNLRAEVGDDVWGLCCLWRLWDGWGRTITLYTDHTDVCRHSTVCQLTSTIELCPQFSTKD